MPASTAPIRRLNNYINLAQSTPPPPTPPPKRELRIVWSVDYATGLGNSESNTTLKGEYVVYAAGSTQGHCGSSKITLAGIESVPHPGDTNPSTLTPLRDRGALVSKPELPAAIHSVVLGRICGVRRRHEDGSAWIGSWKTTFDGVPLSIGVREINSPRKSGDGSPPTGQTRGSLCGVTTWRFRVIFTPVLRRSIRNESPLWTSSRSGAGCGTNAAELTNPCGKQGRGLESNRVSPDETRRPRRAAAAKLIIYEHSSKANSMWPKNLIAPGFHDQYFRSDRQELRSANVVELSKAFYERIQGSRTDPAVGNRSLGSSFELAKKN